MIVLRMVGHFIQQFLFYRGETILPLLLLRVDATVPLRFLQAPPIMVARGIGVLKLKLRIRRLILVEEVPISLRIVKLAFGCGMPAVLLQLATMVDGAGPGTLRSSQPGMQQSNLAAGMGCAMF